MEAAIALQSSPALTDFLTDRARADETARTSLPYWPTCARFSSLLYLRTTSQLLGIGSADLVRFCFRKFDLLIRLQPWLDLLLPHSHERLARNFDLM